MDFKTTIITIAQDDTPGISAAGEGTGDTTGTGTIQPGTGATPGGTGGTGAAPGTSSWMLFLPLILVMVFVFWSSSSAQKKEKRKRNEMLESINKHDKVQTIGGVIGSVVEIKDTEIVLKVDEANNIKMRFSRSAIQQVVSDANTVSADATLTE